MLVKRPWICRSIQLRRIKQNKLKGLIKRRGGDNGSLPAERREWCRCEQVIEEGSKRAVTQSEIDHIAIVGVSAIT